MVGYNVEDQGEASNTDVGQRRTVQRIDQRLQQLFFQYDDVRTNDNIEFEVEGTIFYQIVDVPQMIRATDDPTGDIWHRLRAQIHQAASTYDYAGFLTSLTNLTGHVKARELSEFVGFYDVRGIRLYDLQLIEVELKDKELEHNIVDAMALEAIDRINRVNSEVSEAEVEIVRLNGVYNVDAARAENTRSIEAIEAANALQAEGHAAALRLAQQANAQSLELAAIGDKIAAEQAKAGLLAVLRNNTLQEAERLGAQHGVQRAAELDEYLGAARAAALPLDERLRLYELQLALESANATTRNLAAGAASLYLTPDQANLHLGDAAALRMTNAPAEAPTGSASG